MKINPPLGDLCIQNGPIKFTVDDCNGSIDWTWVTPPGKPDPIITQVNSNTYLVTPPDEPGAYQLTGECCGL